MTQLQLVKKELELDDEEILIDFKPAPVSPDARALLEEMAQPYRRYVSLQKTLSDGEIQVERRELMSEIGEPSYPHTCRRNHPQDPWSKKLHAPVQFSSTPEDLSLLRITSPPDDHYDEVISYHHLLYAYIFSFSLFFYLLILSLCFSIHENSLVY